MDELDSSLVVSQEISEYMNTHKETTQTQELSHAVAALSPNDQMAVETYLNGLVGKMEGKERKEFMERWQKERINEAVHISILTDYHYGHKFASDETHAANLLFEFTHDKSVCHLDWWPKNDLHKTLPIYFRNYSWGGANLPWKAIGQRLGHEMPSMHCYIPDEQEIQTILGKPIRSPSLETCMEYVKARPTAIVCDNTNVIIQSLVWNEDL